jgi:hypothetical protein
MCSLRWEEASIRPKSKVDLFAAIRRDSRIEGLSIRALARKYDVHRRTVREALSSAWPAPRRKPPPRSSRLDPFKPAIDQMLKTDLDAPNKQRHTVKRIYDRLVDELGMEGISYSLVREYVARRRPQIRVEEERGPAQVFIPQSHRPGVEAEVDFGDVYVKLAGVSTKCSLFTFRLSYSGKAVHRSSRPKVRRHSSRDTCTPSGCWAGYPPARFATTTSVRPSPRCWASPGPGWRPSGGPPSTRTMSMEVFYCQPGLKGAHEKGGVEGEVGRFRRNHLVPETATLAELNARIDEWDAADDRRRIGARPRTVGEYFAAEQPLLKPLPDEPFETDRWSSPRVDRYGLRSASAPTVTRCRRG